jgi:glucose-1-phosphate thymidylyltransferase
MKGLLLAGGHGTRLRPLTFTGNKHMIPIANKPMLFYGLESLISAGIREIAIVLGPLHEGIREQIGNGSKLGISVEYIEQPDPKGLAHAVKISENFIGKEPFVMYLGDNLMKEGLKPMIRTYYNEFSDCVICITPVSSPERYGIVELDSLGRLSRLVEKPTNPASNLALAGVYVFNHHIFEAVTSIRPSWRGELEITDAIQYLLEKKFKICVHKTSGWWKDTGRPEDLLEANHLILENFEPTVNVQLNSTINVMGKVSIDENTIIQPNTRLKGPIVIGRNCNIGPNVYVGPYTSIGDNTAILSGEIEGSIVMDNVYIDCKQRIVDSIIARNSRIESTERTFPSGLKLVIGESSLCKL